MDYLFYTSIIIALIVGAMITLLFVKRNPKSDDNFSQKEKTSEKNKPDMLGSTSLDIIQKKYEDQKEEYDKLVEGYNKFLDEYKFKVDGFEKKIKEQEASLSKKDEDRNREIKELKLDYEKLISKASEEYNSKLSTLADGDIDSVLKTQLDEITKLKNKIKKLDDEIEELEEDRDDAELKFKRLRTDFDKKEKLISEQNKQIISCKDSIKSLETDIENKKGIIDIKEKSLSFVREILTAKKQLDSNSEEYEKSINILASFIENDVIAYLNHNNINKWDSSVKQWEYLQDISGLKRWTTIQKKTWIEGKKAIAFIGEFSAGKTSIVNRILSQDKPNITLLPVSSLPTTAIPTYISGAPNTRFCFVSPDHQLKKIEESTFKMVNKDVLDQVSGVSNLISYFVMEYKNDNLKNLSILDTPGFASNDKEDAKRTIEVINECDALFWVFDINSSGTINRNSLKIIKQHLRKPLYIVINKVGGKAPSEIDKVKQKVLTETKDAGIKIQDVICFDCKAKEKFPLSLLMNPINNLQNTQNEDNYVELMQKFISKVSKDLINNNLRPTETKLKELREYTSNTQTGFDKTINALVHNCNYMTTIPQWTEKIFGKDRFEMSAEQGKELFKWLNYASDEQAPAIKNLSLELTKSAEEITKLQDFIHKEREKIDRLEGFSKQINKYITDINKYKN